MNTDKQFTEVEFGQYKVKVPSGGYYDRFRMNPDLDQVAQDATVGNIDFFRKIPKKQIASRVGLVWAPNFYYKSSNVQLLMLAPIRQLRNKLPQPLEPLQALPGYGLVALTFFHYDVCDNDPYNEVSVAIVVRQPQAKGSHALELFRSMRQRHFYAHVVALPVDTEIARIRGVHGYQLPKWLTEIHVNINTSTIHAYLTDTIGQLDLVLTTQHQIKETKTRIFESKYWGRFPGFLSGWNYWVVYILVAMTELTAIAKYIHYWWPHIPAWVSTLFFFIVVTGFNLGNVKFYGESEFWLAIIKVTAVISMIVFGLYLLLTAGADSTASFNNLWQHGGFFPHGFSGLFYMLAFLMFAFGGIELIGMTAAEAENPEKSIPKAINQVIFRILIFYIASLAIIMSLIPWNQLDLGGLDKSPFVMIFSQLGIEWAAHLLNFIILTAALSVYNSGMYANSRMLHGLAIQGNAPTMFAKVTQQGVPVPAVNKH
ncbi:hypothetical protein FQR65_LT19072 [Abscondita terminalis]|nr:hypothetical protein FQR65_LT19072 [Abscondita terminalis]